jgi:opacity protein-like surface antigen
MGQEVALLAHSGATSTNGDDLTLSAYTAGIRYTPRLHMGPLKPFGQVLAGVAHARGSLAEGTNLAASNAGAAFAANVGGGVDLKITRMLALRLIDANYLVTTFNNGDNNHQNNLRLSAGVVHHF